MLMHVPRHEDAIFDFKRGFVAVRLQGSILSTISSLIFQQCHEFWNCPIPQLMQQSDLLKPTTRQRLLRT